MSAPLTVACVFVQGEYPYTPDYVTRLQAMVTRWIDRPWLFSPPIDTVPVTKLAGFAPWTKLELFNPARHWQGRVLYLDLDSLVVDSLVPIVDVPAPFAITADPTNAKPKPRDSFGHWIVRRFNSSVMVWDGGTRTELYTSWTPAIVHRLSGDQDWVGERLPEAATLPREWFPRLSELHGQPPRPPAKVVLCKVPKNSIAQQEHAWFASLWGAA